MMWAATKDVKLNVKNGCGGESCDAIPVAFVIDNEQVLYIT